MSTSEIVADLIERRKLLGLSQYEVAMKGKINRTSIAHYERGTYAPSVDGLIRWCAGLGLEMKIVTVNRKDIRRDRASPE